MAFTDRSGPGTWWRKALASIGPVVAGLALAGAAVGLQGAGQGQLPRAGIPRAPTSGTILLVHFLRTSAADAPGRPPVA
jgi:hypothetical protein